uniref:Uncharacterized protein n=1 Tax=Panagrolaimus sp. JU765 TaxID=591449 RepID=A0AC34PZP4_9BILA
MILVSLLFCAIHVVVLSQNAANITIPTTREEIPRIYLESLYNFNGSDICDKGDFYYFTLNSLDRNSFLKGYLIVESDTDTKLKVFHENYLEETEAIVEILFDNDEKKLVYHYGMKTLFVAQNGSYEMQNLLQELMFVNNNTVYSANVANDSLKNLKKIPFNSTHSAIPFEIKHKHLGIMPYLIKITRGRLGFDKPLKPEEESRLYLMIGFGTTFFSTMILTVPFFIICFRNCS